MKLSDLFKVSLIATAVSLAGCGGDLVVSEGDTTINAVSYTHLTLPTIYSV